MKMQTYTFELKIEATSIFRTSIALHQIVINKA